MTEASLVPSWRTMPAYTPCKSESENSGAGVGQNLHSSRPASSASPAATRKNLLRRESRPASLNPTCEIVAKSAKDVGIGISTEFPQFPTMYAKLQNGDFDLAMYNYGGVSPASPWIRFRDALDDRGVPAVGKTAFWNYNRFKNAEVAAHVDAAAGAKSDAEAKAAYSALDKIYRENIPVVPLMYRPLSFYQFNASNWENFPTEENPYAPPMWSGAGIGWLFKIKKIGT